MITSTRTLKILAAGVWYLGGIALLLKGRTLLLEANLLRPDQIWPTLALTVGMILGGLEAWFRFRKSCQRNLARIDSLEKPKLWQFFRPGFFIALLIMIAGGRTLSYLAGGNYSMLIGVAALDITIGVALLGSSYMFWTNRGFKQKLVE